MVSCTEGALRWRCHPQKFAPSYSTVHMYRIVNDAMQLLNKVIQSVMDRWCAIICLSVNCCAYSPEFTQISDQTFAAFSSVYETIGTEGCAIAGIALLLCTVFCAKALMSPRNNNKTEQVYVSGAQVLKGSDEETGLYPTWVKVGGTMVCVFAAVGGVWYKRREAETQRRDEQARLAAEEEARLPLERLETQRRRAGEARLSAGEARLAAERLETQLREGEARLAARRTPVVGQSVWNPLKLLNKEGAFPGRLCDQDGLILAFLQGERFCNVESKLPGEVQIDDCLRFTKRPNSDDTYITDAVGTLKAGPIRVNEQGATRFLPEWFLYAVKRNLFGPFYLAVSPKYHDYSAMCYLFSSYRDDNLRITGVQISDIRECCYLGTLSECEFANTKLWINNHMFCPSSRVDLGVFDPDRQRWFVTEYPVAAYSIEPPDRFVMFGEDSGARGLVVDADGSLTLGKSGRSCYSMRDLQIQ